MPLYQTEKKFKRPTPIQREFHGIKKKAIFERVTTKETKKHILITTVKIEELQRADGYVEETSEIPASTARIPKSLLKELVEYLSFIEKNPDKKKRKRKQ